MGNTGAGLCWRQKWTTACTWECTRYCVLACSAGAEMSGECVIALCSVHLDWVGLWKVPAIRFDTNTQAAKAYLWSTGVTVNRRCEGRWEEQHSVTDNIRCAHTHTRMKFCQIVNGVTTRMPINKMALSCSEGRDNAGFQRKHTHHINPHSLTRIHLLRCTYAARRQPAVSPQLVGIYGAQGCKIYRSTDFFFASHGFVSRLWCMWRRWSINSVLIAAVNIADSEWLEYWAFVQVF